MCPAQVYEIGTEGGDGTVTVNVAPSNCVQCGAITAKGGRLTPPEGGSGPEYTLTRSAPLPAARAFNFHERVRRAARPRALAGALGGGPRRASASSRKASRTGSSACSLSASRPASRRRGDEPPGRAPPARRQHASGRSCSCSSPPASPRTRCGGSSRRCVRTRTARRRSGGSAPPISAAPRST